LSKNNDSLAFIQTGTKTS